MLLIILQQNIGFVKSIFTAPAEGTAAHKPLFSSKTGFSLCIFHNAVRAFLCTQHIRSPVQQLFVGFYTINIYKLSNNISPKILSNVSHGSDDATCAEPSPLSDVFSLSLYQIPYRPLQASEFFRHKDRSEAL